MKDDPSDGETWTIIIATEGEGPPAAEWVKRLLKYALRSFRLRCVSVRQSNGGASNRSRPMVGPDKRDALQNGAGGE